MIADRRADVSFGTFAGLRLAAARHAARLAAAVLPPRLGVRVLLYHSIVATDGRDPGQMTTPISLFEEQIAYLVGEGYAVLAAEEILARWQSGAPVPANAVAITFDDGFADNLTLALPVLQAYRVPATVFAVASWHSRGGEYLDTRQLRELQQSGLVRIGCHSATHRRLSGLPPSAIEEEIAGAKRMLEDQLSADVPLFAYPYGSFRSWDAQTRAAVETAGFAGAFTSVFGVNTIASDRLLLRRTRVSWRDRLPEFARILRGAYDWYALVQRVQGSVAR